MAGEEERLLRGGDGVGRVPGGGVDTYGGPPVLVFDRVKVDLIGQRRYRRVVDVREPSLSVETIGEKEIAKLVSNNAHLEVLVLETTGVSAAAVMEAIVQWRYRRTRLRVRIWSTREAGGVSTSNQVYPLSSFPEKVSPNH